MIRSLVRLFGAGLIGLLAALLLVGGVQAGGWSVVVLDGGSPLTGAEGAGGVVAGEPISFGFLVLQHGRTPIDGLTPRITAISDSGKTINAFARAEGRPGHYVAELTLPSAGVWNWQIEAFGPPADMAPITVLAAAPAAAPTSALAGAPVFISLAALVLAGALAAVIFARARRPAAA